VVTGASSSLGQATAERLAGHGAAVALLTRSADDLLSTVARITELGGTALALPADLADASAIEAAVAGVAAELGRIDVPVNAAATDVPGPGRASASTIAEAAPHTAAYLLVARSAAADAGYPAAAAWLARALAMDLEDRGLVNAAHEQARRHRSPDPAAFDQDWARRTGRPVPAWLTVDSALLSSARAWMAADTYAAERDYLAAHPELLEAAADTAVAEALLAVPEDEAGRYTALRQAAQHDGADAVYRPLLLTILAHEFAAAGPAGQSALLADRADDLVTSTVTDTLNELAGQEDQQAAAAQRATALLSLAQSRRRRAGLGGPGRTGPVPRLLHTLAIRTDAASAGPAALVAYTAALTPAEAATAVFYLAAAAAAEATTGKPVT
jgi:NAD(P)-dependent dehydrogenase (short-subunit alcohol dehydrogenase family)